MKTLLKKIIVFFSTLMLAGCSFSNSFNKSSTCKIVFEQNENIEMSSYVYEVSRGHNLNVLLTFKNSATFISSSYSNYEFKEINPTKGNLLLKDIRYSEYVSINISMEYIVYNPNGGTALNGETNVYKGPTSLNHIRNNTAIGPKIFKRDGYVQVGWNTKPDYSGDFVGCGSRVRKDVKLLFAQWEKETNPNDFEFSEVNEYIYIQKYLKDEQKVVIPKQINGMDVVRIGTEAFANKQIESVILPETIREIGIKSFDSCLKLKEITFYDSLKEISDSSFVNCPNFTTLHINAYLNPTYSATYFDAFQDKVDYLDSIKNQKKIILFSGSSTRYGFWSEMFMEEFPGYACANMGVFAYIPAITFMDVIEKYLLPDDVLINAPEFDVPVLQFFNMVSFEERTYALFEANYDSLAFLDISKYSKVFSSYSRYQINRSYMPLKNYDFAAKYYDDDGNHYDYETYNIYGDMTIVRPNHPRDELIYQPLTEYQVAMFPQEYIDSYNAYYNHIKDMGVEMVFTYAPKNHHAIYGTNEEIDELQNYLKANLDVPIISDIWDSIFTGYYFYLIDNHLSDEGATIRTRNVINDLKVYFSSIGK